jgi:hypothetical protein
MSAISFPHGHLSESSRDDAPGFYSNAFESSGSSFQMNPLSSHPPRTPRTSIIKDNTSQVYGVQVYASNDPPADNEPIHEVEVDEEDEKLKKRAARIRRQAVWKEMLKTSVGRDKAFVCKQSHSSTKSDNCGQMYLESHTVRPEIVLAFPCIPLCYTTSPTTESRCLGS